MADPNTTGTTTGATTPETAPGVTPGTTTAGTTTGATTAGTTAYTADTARTAPTDTTPVTRKDTSATKGLVVGLLTFIGLWILELAINSTPLPAYGRISIFDMIVYIVIGVVVGVVVKMIDKSRTTKV